MRNLVSGITSAAMLVVLLSSSAHAQDVGSTDPQTAPAEESGYGNVDIYEAGRFRMRDKRNYENLIILGPTILPPGLNVRYDRGLSDRISLVVGAGYGAIGAKDGEVASGFSSIRGLVGMNWQPIGNGMHGFYLGPRVRVNHFSVKVSGDGETANGSITTLGVAAVVGYRWIWDPGFSLGLGLGGQYFAAVNQTNGRDAEGNEVEADFNFDGFFPAIEFTLGWAF
jgi:opacity protein-like surface antigen